MVTTTNGRFQVMVINKRSLREKRNANLIYTGSITSCAYVQFPSKLLEIFHSLCKTHFTKSEPETTLFPCVQEPFTTRDSWFFNPF